jgi:hypothetical protein
MSRYRVFIRIPLLDETDYRKGEYPELISGEKEEKKNAPRRTRSLKSIGLVTVAAVVIVAMVVPMIAVTMESAGMRMVACRTLRAFDVIGRLLQELAVRELDLAPFRLSR